MKIFTIGCTKTTAEHFFTRLMSSGATCIIDVRLKNASQLAGFAKRDDLSYFAKALCGMDYRHVPELAPTQAMLEAYRKHKVTWTAYEADFLQLIRRRRIETLGRALVEGGCLLCSEHEPHHCHRRTVAEYLRGQWGDLEIEHL